jgi:hypothetical protein
VPACCRCLLLLLLLLLLSLSLLLSLLLLLLLLFTNTKVYMLPCCCQLLISEGLDSVLPHITSVVPMLLDLAVHGYARLVSSRSSRTRQCSKRSRVAHPQLSSQYSCVSHRLPARADQAAFCQGSTSQSSLQCPCDFSRC